MTNHPRRSKTPDPRSIPPTPEAIRQWREECGLTQTEAAHLIWCTLSAWQRWEAGTRKMHPAFWEAVRARRIEREIELDDGSYVGKV